MPESHQQTTTMRGAPILVCVLLLIVLAVACVVVLLPQYRCPETTAPLTHSTPTPAASEQDYAYLPPGLKGGQVMVLPVGRQPNEHSTFGVVEIPQHKLLLCTLAKVGSTQWRRMAIRLSGLGHWDTNDTDWLHSWKRNGLKQLWMQPDSVVADRLVDPEWTRVAVVRNPLARFLSGYSDKIKQNHEYWRLPKSLARDNAEDPPTFQEFAETLLRHPQPDIEMDDHWRKQSAQCSFRYVHFEHVIRFEHMGAGAHAVFNQLGLWEEYGAHGWHGTTGEFLDANRATHSTGSSSADKLRAAYAEPGLLQLVTSYYAEDFARFQYSVPHTAQDITNDLQ